MRGLLIALLLTILYSSALAETTPDVKGVKWYQDHPEERKAMLDRCNDNPGQLRNDPNCINAKRAALSMSGGSVKRPGPVGQQKIQ